MVVAAVAASALAAVGMGGGRSRDVDGVHERLRGGHLVRLGGGAQGLHRTVLCPAVERKKEGTACGAQIPQVPRARTCQISGFPPYDGEVSQKSSRLDRSWPRVSGTSDTHAGGFVHMSLLPTTTPVQGEEIGRAHV